MIFRELPLAGAFLLEPERHADERGHFARTFCQREMAAHGLETGVAQASLSWNAKAGTLRGLHFQAEPHAEAKLVRVGRGAIHDVIVDLRPGSPTRGRYLALTLSADNGAQLYVPPGFAHGFQTLADDTEVNYLISAFYEPAAGRGYRFDDPAFGILWPLAVSMISERDLGWPAFAAEVP